ncbi:MAG: hypothetical protein AAF741_07350 [Bacteroidota bacterium]
MSVFGDLKRIFFGAKSVVKHKGGQALDKAKETAGDLAEKASDAFEDLGDKISEKAGDAYEKAEGLADRAGDALEDLGEKFSEKAEQVGKKASEKMGSAGEKLSEQAGSAYEKASGATKSAGDWLNEQFSKMDTQSGDSKDSSINLTDDIVPEPGTSTTKKAIDFEAGLEGELSSEEPSAFSQAADSALDAAAKAGLQAKDAAEKLGQKAMEKGDELLNKAAEKGAELKDKFDDLVGRASEAAEAEAAKEEAEKARLEAEIEAAKNKSFGGDANSRDTSESTLDGSDSFFDRASRYADGDYHNEGGKDVRLEKDPDYKKTIKDGDIQGFDDEDNDGDPLIDDAEVLK